MQKGFRTGLPTKTERLAAGRGLREKIKRGELGRWRPKSDRLRGEIERSANLARNQTSDRALPKLTRERDGDRRMVEQPPLVTLVSDDEKDRIIDRLEAYLTTLLQRWRRVLGSYLVVEVAHKLVGVGSVGLRAFVVLQGNGSEDMLFLQLKQSRRSCVAPFVHGDTAWHAHQGQPVVEYQQTPQKVCDPLLGWTTVDKRDYYVRHFRDMKGAPTVEGIDGCGLMDYGRICGALLAKGDARLADPAILTGYLGNGDASDRAFARFACGCADQTEADHHALQQAIRAGRLPAEPGV